MELEVDLARDDFGTKMEEKSWLYSFNKRQAAPRRQLFICEEGLRQNRFLTSQNSQLRKGRLSIPR